MKKVLDAIDKLIGILIVIMLISMVFSITLQVFTRYVLGSPLSWTEELSRRIMIWVVFIAAALAYRRNAQVGVDIVTSLLPKKVHKYFMIFTDICIVFFAAFMVIHGSGLMSKGMNQMSSAIGIKMGYIYSAIPIGGILLIIFGIEKIIERLRTQNQLGSEG